MKLGKWSWILCAMTVSIISACGGDDDDGGFEGDYTLTLIATDFGAHNGQTLHVAVTEAGSLDVITHDKVTVEDDGFTFTWPMILRTGHSYEIHYYADFNNNGGCDAPPIDHGWLVEVNLREVTGDVTINVTHDIPNGIHDEEEAELQTALEGDDHDDDDHEHGFDEEVCEYF